MVAFPYAIPYGSGAAVSESFDALITAIKSFDYSPSILNSKPTPGTADTLRAPEKNKFDSFYGKKSGTNKNVFNQKHLLFLT